MPLRFHHGLCLSFFEGKGYSGDFTENMAEKKAMLERDDPIVTLTCKEDIICAKCPHNKGGECESAEKVNRYDTAVMKLCGFSSGESLHYKDLSRKVAEVIIQKGRLHEVCSDCSWNEICFRSQKLYK